MCLTNSVRRICLRHGKKRDLGLGCRSLAGSLNGTAGPSVRRARGRDSEHGLSSLCLPMRSEDIHAIVRILRKEARQWPLPAIGHYVETPFTTLISCILSLRTQDKTTNAASERLFAIANTAETMLATPVDVIERAIYPVSFYRVKSLTIHKICEQLTTRFEGNVPDNL